MKQIWSPTSSLPTFFGLCSLTSELIYRSHPPPLLALTRPPPNSLTHVVEFIRNGPGGSIEGTNVECNAANGAGSFIDNQGRLKDNNIVGNSLNGALQPLGDCAPRSGAAPSNTPK